MAAYRHRWTWHWYTVSVECLTWGWQQNKNSMQANGLSWAHRSIPSWAKSNSLDFIAKYHRGSVMGHILFLNKTLCWLNLTQATDKNWLQFKISTIPQQFTNICCCEWISVCVCVCVSVMLCMTKYVYLTFLVLLILCHWFFIHIFAFHAMVFFNEVVKCFESQNASILYIFPIIIIITCFPLV